MRSDQERLQDVADPISRIGRYRARGRDASVYFSVDLGVVRDMVEHHVDPLREQVERILPSEFPE